MTSSCDIPTRLHLRITRSGLNSSSSNPCSEIFAESLSLKESTNLAPKILSVGVQPRGSSNASKNGWREHERASRDCTTTSPASTLCTRLAARPPPPPVGAQNQTALESPHGAAVSYPTLEANASFSI
ncbi:hypothetical protein KC19_VG216300 [Ceratodon purpureus]|uniref:Uncharacterized protein n=1 Tax=Ceratodon purpureus TaxID=3225 RepID=A0A8T0HSH4_CERPU|nr:hypothetical protein KC19_VG216300 [Ceratodon purpureus]